MTSYEMLRRGWGVVFFVALIAVSAVLARAEPPVPEKPDYVSLEGKPPAEGNPLENDVLKQFNAPVLLLYRTQAAAPLGTILLFPGGGYRLLEMKREGENTARFLNGQGFDVVLLEYHLVTAPETRDMEPGAALRQTREAALAEALQAFRLIRSGAASLNLHGGRFGIMGYSAGGHLAARTAQALDAAEQPDDLILGYPAYLDKRDIVVMPPAKPGRLFVVIGDKDNAGWVESSGAYAEAWKATGGSAVFHLLPGIGHGFGMVAPPVASTARWTDLLAAFLQEKNPRVAP